MFVCESLLADQSTYTHHNSKVYVWPLCERKHRKGVGERWRDKRSFIPIPPLSRLSEWWNIGNNYYRRCVPPLMFEGYVRKYHGYLQFETLNFENLNFFNLFQMQYYGTIICWILCHIIYQLYHKNKYFTWSIITPPINAFYINILLLI